MFFQRAARDDEGSVRELRGAEDDRRERADAAQGADAQDPTASEFAAEVHVREAHHRQVGEVLHESTGFHGLYRRGVGTDRTTHQWGALIFSLQ